MFGEIFVQWVVNGAYYSLLALGFALIFGAARVVNLYHGTFFMLGAYFTYSYFTIGAPLYVAALLSMITVAVVGYAVFLIIEPIRKKGVAVLIVSIGLAFLTQALIKIFYGEGSKSIPKFLNFTDEAGKAITNIHVLGAPLSTDRLFVLIVAAVMIFLLWIFMDKTKIGKGVMAVAQDEEAAMTVGVNPKLANMAAVAFSAILAAVAGMSTAPFLPVNDHMWLDPLIKAFAIVILGGLGSVWGSVLAAFILALAEALTNNLVDPSLGAVVFLVVVLVMLVTRPQGLLGKPIRF